MNYRLREREARKWTFVRDWEKEPTPSERDFRTSVSDVTWSVCLNTELDELSLTRTGLNDP